MDFYGVPSKALQPTININTSSSSSNNSNVHFNNNAGMLEVQRTGSSTFSNTSSGHPHNRALPPTLSVVTSPPPQQRSPTSTVHHQHQHQHGHPLSFAAAAVPRPSTKNSTRMASSPPGNNKTTNLTYASLDHQIHGTHAATTTGTNGLLSQPLTPTSTATTCPTNSTPRLPPPPTTTYQQQQQHHHQQHNPHQSSATLPPPTRESVLQRLSEALLRRSLAKIDLSQKGLSPQDARLVKMALLQNRQLRVLKLGYNQLGDAGLRSLVTGISQHSQLQSLDLGFNNIGDVGCQALADAIRTNHSHNSINSNLAGGGGGNQEEASPHKSVSTLSTLYLAGNCIGQDGAVALADVIRLPNCTLQRLYLTGNRLGPEGVKAITEAILEHSMVIKLSSSYDNNNYNNSNAMEITPETETAETGIPHHQQQHRRYHHHQQRQHQATTTPAAASLLPPPTSMTRGMQELFLGGTGLGPSGCQAVARLLESPDCRLKVLSLANCDITDDEITRQDWGLAPCIKRNRGGLPLASLQLSFNAITHKGLEALMNALWGSKTLKELRLDNNDVGDRGAQQLAAILPYLKTLETLDVGFNNINNKNQGMKILMKAVAETNNLTTLSLSGNPMQDVASAKAVAYALAYNVSLQSLLLVHCHLTTEGQRHVAAGAVSNSRTSLRELSGFPVGPVIVTLGFPDALEHWTNDQVLNFIHLMWNRTKAENENGKEEEEEKGLDPLNFLPGSSSASENHQPGRRSGPLEATMVVDVARKAFASLVANGVDVFSRRPGHPNAMASPAVFAPRDAIMLESVDGDSIVESMGEVAVSSSPSSNDMASHTNGGAPPLSASHPAPMTSAKKMARSFVAPPQERDAGKHSQLPDPSRKKRIVEWLCSNIKHLNKLSQMPFDSGELLKLHQHYFTPVVNESGGASAYRHDSNTATSSASSRQAFSVPNVSRDSSNNHHFEDMSSPSLSSTTTLQSGDVGMIPASDPMFMIGKQQHSPQRPQQRSGQQSQAAASSLPMLKRKVSYRFLGDAAMHQQNFMPAPPTSSWGNAFGGGSNLGSVAKMIQEGPSCHSLPPKNKKARRNRTRISFLPRIKAKLDSYLDVCHEKALITMRQLYYVEQAILNGRVNPLDADSPRTHLSGALATDAETIVVDMI